MYVSYHSADKLLYSIIPSLNVIFTDKKMHCGPNYHVCESLEVLLKLSHHIDQMREFKLMFEDVLIVLIEMSTN